MGNKNQFEGHEPAKQPEIAPPQAWGDKTPRALDLKKQILADVQKNVITGDVTKIDKS